MYIVPSQGNMPPVPKIVRVNPRSAAQRLSQSRASSSPEAAEGISCNRLASAAEIVSRCIATPSAQAPVRPHGLHQGSMLLTGMDSAAHVSNRGRALSLAGSASRNGKRHFVQRLCSMLQSNSSSTAGSPKSESFTSRSLDELNVGISPRRQTKSLLDSRPKLEFYVRSLKHASFIARAHSGPGSATCGPLEGASEPTTTSIPKEPAFNSGNLQFTSGACCLPHPEKLQTGGEDAHFISSDPNIYAVGVADGVGGWADMGIDAGVYARELMKQSALAVAESGEKGEANPRFALKKAHSLTKSSGSSTACIIVLDNDRIRAANLGDSGFIVIRNGRTLFKSPPQQHDFNFPFQLGSKGCDLPEVAEEFLFPVAAGDILVVGTDGLFDNLFDSELTSVVMHSVKAGWSPKETAERIATLAHLRAQDPLRQSPFAKSAQEAGYRFWGGKMDDITVVVSYITSKDTKKFL